MMGLTRRRGRRASDAGMTLVELSVAMMIMGVVLSLLAVAFNSDLKVTKTVDNRTSSTNDSGTALENMTRRLRVAVQPANRTSAFDTTGDLAGSASTASVIGFYSSWTTNRTGAPSATTPVPTLYQYSVNSATNCLQETSIAGVTTGTITSWPSANKRTRCIVKGAVSVTFTYYDTGTSTAGITNLPNVDSVGVSLSVANSTSDSHPVVTTDRVTLTNLLSNETGS